MTWQYIDTIERPWYPIAIAADQVVLETFNPAVPMFGAYMFWPSMEMEVWTEREPWPTGASAEDPILVEPSAQTKAMIAEIEGSEWDERIKLIPQSIREQQVPAASPGAVRVVLRAIQQGPFLRVAADVDGCLSVIADHSPDAAELDCMAGRVLLTDLGETVEIEGVTWHKVRTPAGIEGWTDGRYLG